MIAAMGARWQAGELIRGTVYRVNRHIATGGMGSLYEVEDTSVGRLYVLKTLHPELIDREDLAIRMREEARALGRLDHPNIVQVITAGVTAEMAPTPFYVMERLVGQNLRGVLEARHGIGKAHAYRIAIDVLDALQHAHEAGMIHRDVKPENIFLHRGKTGTQTKLLDFGIVRLLNKHASLTRGKFIGTLKYAAPEQVTGRNVSPATDIYAAALVIYEMLRGSGPFDLAGDAYAIGAAHVSTPAPSLGALVPPSVDAVIMQALAKDPAMRPPSCGLISAELRRALRAEEERADAATDLDLLSARHPLEGEDSHADTELGAPATATVTAPRQVTTRIEGAWGAAPMSATVAAPIPPGPVSPVTPAHVVASGIDRNAPTRITPPEPPRSPSNDTRIDAPEPAVIVSVTPVPAPPSPPSTKPVGQNLNTTVHTRPIKKDRFAVAAVAIAATLAVLMIVGALVLVRRPWDGARNRSVGAAVSTGTTH